MSKKSFIDSVKVGSPCSEKWDEMTGNERVRLCSHCAKHVNDISTMGRKEAARFVRSSDREICIRYIVDPVTRRPVFAHQLLQITRRTPVFAAGALTATIAVSSATYAQQPTPTAVRTPTTVEQTVGNDTQVRGEINPRPIQDLPPNPQPMVMGGVMIAVEYRSELSKAVADEDKEGIRQLIMNGSNVNAKEASYSKITPMFLAVETGDLEIVQMLLDAGAKVNVRSASGETALMRLDSDGTRALVELLIRYGAKVNAVDKEGNTPLLHAAESSTDDAIAALLDAGADVNVADSDGETPLIYAASRGSLDSVRALLLKGAVVNARNTDGESAWDKTDREDIKELLVSFGAEVPEDKAQTSPTPVPEPTPPM